MGLPLPIKAINNSVKLGPLAELGFGVGNVRSTNRLTEMTTDLNLTRGLTTLQTLTADNVRTNRVRVRCHSLTITINTATTRIPILIGHLGGLPRIGRGITGRTLRRLEGSSL